jgi:hypothetical protein
MQILAGVGGEQFIVATGGTENTYTSGGFTYKSHKFTTSGTFTVTSLGSSSSVDVLVVAGGGGTGADRRSGGGAGGFRTNTQTLVSATGYTVTVGTAGPYNTQTTRGGNSSFVGASTITSTGGGSGGLLIGGIFYDGNSGGSGGGGSTTGSPGAGNAGAFSPVEGYSGGAQTDTIQGGAGGGAGGIGGGSTSGNTAGASNDYETGSNQTYAEGGAGGSAGASTSTALGSGAAGTVSAAAKDGVVIIRYRIA